MGRGSNEASWHRCPWASTMPLPQKNLERTVVRLEVKGVSWPPEIIARCVPIREDIEVRPAKRDNACRAYLSSDVRRQPSPLRTIPSALELHQIVPPPGRCARAEGSWAETPVPRSHHHRSGLAGSPPAHPAPKVAVMPSLWCMNLERSDTAFSIPPAGGGGNKSWRLGSFRGG